MENLHSHPMNEEPLWEYGDIGFDTGKLLWFIQLTDKTNRLVNTRQARRVVIQNATSAQYQWKDAEGRPFWHVRERFFARDVEAIVETPDGSVLIRFKPGISEPPSAPQNYAYLLFAYHLQDKDPKESKAPMGFVEFYDEGGNLVGRIDKKWIILEGVTHFSTGVYPSIRMRVDRANISSVALSSTIITIRGIG